MANAYHYILLMLLVLGSCIMSHAQQDAYWHFGDSVVLKWDTLGPTVMPQSAMDAWEPSASISDSAGNLLFYTNGNRIWNRNNVPMPNGDSVITGPVDPFFTVTSGVLILPYPDQPDWYVVFCIGYDLSNPLSFYSVVDLTLDGGFGDVIPGKKGILLDSIDVTEKCAAVRHANGRDWWIAQYQEYHPFLLQADSTFNFYLLTPNGVSFSHSQTIGLHGVGLRRGEMVFSEDGTKLGFSGSLGIQVYGFDRCSGLLTEPIMRLPGQWGYGGAFSPNGRFFYFTTEVNRQLYQYDLEPISNTDSLVLIYEESNPSIVFGQLELGNDNRLYVNITANTTVMPSIVQQYLHVINSPNNYGLSSDFQPFQYDLQGNLATAGLPNMPNYNLGRLEGSPCDTVYAIDTTSSISSPQALDAWAVVPTVSSDWFTVHGTTATTTVVQLSVHDALGRIVLQQEGPLPQRFDLSAEPVGAYFIRASEKGYTQTFRVLKP
jgi:hypothetical protein